MDFFKVTHFCLAIVGHNLKDPSKNWPRKFHWLCLVITGSANFFMIWSTIHTIQDLPLATASLSVSMTNQLTVLKWFVFLLQESVFAGYVEQLQEVNEKFQKYDTRGRLLTAYKSTDKFEHRYYKLCMLTGFYFCVMPMTKLMWQLFKNELDVKQLPYPLKLPFDYQALPLYALSYFYCCLVTWFLVWYIPAIDSHFYSFAIILSTNFQILQDAIKTNEFNGTELELHETTSDYAKHHNILLELSSSMCVLYKPVIFAKFLLTSLQVCLIVFQIVRNTDNIIVLIPNVQFIFVILLQLLIYCYGGERVMHESLQTNLAIQTSRWDKLSPNQRKSMAFMMHRSQKPAIIEAGFYKATLESFMTIVQAAASYITLMQSFEQEAVTA